MSGSANVTSLPKSPEIAAPVSSGLRRSMPPVSQHDEFRSLLTLTIPRQEIFTDSVEPPPDSSPERPPHVAPQTYLPIPPSFTRPTDQLTSRGDLAPRPLPKRSYTSNCRRLLRGLKEFSRQFEILEGGWTATARTEFDDFDDFGYFLYSTSLLESIPPNPEPRLLVAKEHEPDGSGGFCETTRTGRLLSKRHNDGNKPFCRSFLYRYTGAEPEPYSSSRFFSEIDPPLPHRRTIDRSDSSSRCRSSSRMELILASNSCEAMFPILTSAFSNRMSHFPPRPSYSQEIWHFACATVLLPSSGVPNSLLYLDSSVRATRGTLVPQRRWTIPFEGEAFQHADDDTLQPLIFFVNWNSGAGFWLPDILHDYHHEPWEQDNEAPLRGRSGATLHIWINVRSPTFIQSAEIFIHPC